MNLALRRTLLRRRVLPSLSLLLASYCAVLGWFRYYENEIIFGLSLITRNEFDSRKRISQVAMPKLFLHARDDSKIPFAHGQRLYDVALTPKSLHELGGDHGTSHTVDPSFFAAVDDFVRAQGLPLAI